MFHHVSLRSLPWLVVLLMVSCKGCFEGSSARATADSQERQLRGPVEKGPIKEPLRDESPPIPEGGGDDLQVLDTKLFSMAGETDFKNRYLSTIMVAAGDSWAGGSCSGVLISSRLALTSAHCLCERRKVIGLGGAARFMSDSSACVRLAYATMVTYDPATARVGTGGRTQVQQGRVLPHPEFELQIDDRGRILSSKADLALIRLDEPFEAQVPVSPLADDAVRVGEVLIMAGYGHDSLVGGLYGLRSFRRNRVTRVGTSLDDRILYEQQGPYLYNGYEGGPCFREEGPVRWLVGIANLGTDQELSFTGLYAYRDWVRAAINDTRGSTSQ